MAHGRSRLVQDDAHRIVSGMSLRLHLLSQMNSPAQRSFSKTNGLGNFLRRKTMPNLRTELKEYVEVYKPSFIYFVDDSFPVGQLGEGHGPRSVRRDL